MIHFIIITLLMTVPANVFMLYAALGIQGCYVRFSHLLAYGALAGAALSLFRMWPFPLGLHTLLHPILVLILVKRLSGGRWSMAVLGSLMTYVIAAIGEGLIGVPIMALLGIPLIKTLSNPWLNIAGGWMGNSLLILLCLYLALRRRARLRGSAA